MTIDEAATLLVKNLENWIKADIVEGAFNSFNKTWYVDTQSLLSYIEEVESISYKRRHLEKKEKIISQELAQADHLLQKLSIARKLNPLFKLWINELIAKIADPVKQRILKNFALGKDIETVAMEMSMSEFEVSKIYHLLIKELQKCEKILLTYTQTVEQLEEQVKSLLLYSRNYEQRLEALNKKYPEIDLSIPVIKSYDLKLLYKSLERDFQFNQRTVYALHGAGMYTLEDLLRYTLEKGFDGLLELKNFGEKSLQHLRQVLRNEGILEYRDYTHLYIYLK